MAGPDAEPVLILAPNGRDATVLGAMLSRAGIACEQCSSLPNLLQCLESQGGAAALVAEEALQRIDSRDLAAWIAAQPPWSDFPFILLTLRAGSSADTARLVDLLGNVTILERPLHPVTLTSAVHAARRARQRQRQAEAYLNERNQAAEDLRLSEEALRRANETLEERVAERTRQLAAANDRLTAEMAERSKAEEALVQAQKIEAVGQLTAGVAHDFNNLLTAVLGNLDFLERVISPEDQRNQRRIAAMRGAAERGAKLTGQLLAFSRRQRLEPRPVDLNEVVAGMGDLLRSTIGGTVRIETVLKPDLWPALADPTQVEVAILNLAINARDAMPVGGAITIETRNATLNKPSKPADPPTGDYVEVAVSDTGVGMAPDVLARAFEPFFTTKEPGKGSGLGLSQVFGLTRQLGGGVRIKTRVGEGTSVKIYLPRAAAASQPAHVELVSEPPPIAGASVLVVDDDSDVRAVTVGMLQDLGCAVTEAASGPAALDVLDKSGDRIDVMLVDFAMPGMNGVEVVRRAREKWTALPILFVTGYADTEALAADVGAERIVQKPFRRGELATKIADVLHPSQGTNIVRLRHSTRAL